MVKDRIRKNLEQHDLSATTRVTTIETQTVSTTASHDGQHPSSRGYPNGDDDPFPVHHATVQVAYPLHPAIFVTQ